MRARPTPGLLDGSLALGLTVWAVVEGGAVSRVAVFVAMTAAIAWCHRAPVAVLVVEIVGLAVLTNHMQWPGGVALLIAGFNASLYSERRLAVPLLLLAGAVSFLAFGSEVTIPNGLTPFLLLAPVWLAGSAIRDRELRAETAAARADLLELEGEAALRAERARIARELHDVVTHSVSVMVMQSGAAREIMEKDPERSRSLLESVEGSGRAALGELRRLLGLLSDDGDGAPLAPQPGVTEIPSLVEQVRDAGLSIELRVEGEPRGLSEGVAVAVYRIVQEGLTNVLKHAAGAQTRIVLRWGSAELELEIRDTGSARAADGHAGRPGRGLAGMRERAAMYGGTLDAGSEPDGGYAVTARIPFQPGRA